MKGKVFLSVVLGIIAVGFWGFAMWVAYDAGRKGWVIFMAVLAAYVLQAEVEDLWRKPHSSAEPDDEPYDEY